MSRCPKSAGLSQKVKTTRYRQDKKKYLNVEERKGNTEDGESETQVQSISTQTVITQMRNLTMFGKCQQPEIIISMG